MNQTDITVGSRIVGILPTEAVEILQVKTHGAVIEVFYQTGRGNMGKRMLYEEDLAHLQLANQQLPWQFDGDADTFKLASEAYRIELAHLFDPFLAACMSSRSRDRNFEAPLTSTFEGGNCMHVIPFAGS